MKMPVFAAVVSGLLMLLAPGFAGEAKSYVAAGATTVQPIVQQCARKFKQLHPDVDFVVGAGGSDHGVETVANGKVQLGLVGRSLKEGELKKYPDLKPVTIGQDGIALVVHSSNPVRKLNKQQIQDIYTGKITNWKDVGGKDAPICLASRTKGHAQLELFLKYFDMEIQFDASGDNGAHKTASGELSKVQAKTAINNDKMMEQLVLEPNTLAYLPLGFAQTKTSRGAPLAAVELDGIAATMDNVANGTYPLRRPLLVVTNGAADGMMKEFITFLLSDEGQAIVSSLDYIPAKASAPATK